MRAKLFAGVFALMLCMGVFLFPVTAFAASDTTPPTIDAWLGGDTLHIEAGDDDSGVEAVYMDSRRYNYFVDGVVQVNAKEHHGGNENISVYAIDFAGNKSRVIEIRNPFYKATAAPAPSSAPQGTTPRPDPEPPSSSSSSSQTSRPASTPPATSTPEPSSPSEPTSSAVPGASGANPFTPDGQAEVLDNATDDDGKEFFTITTPEGNIFFLVIDRQRNSDNVYLLNAVTEYDLTQLAEDGGSTTQSAVPDPEPAPTKPPPSTSEPEPSPEPAPEEKPASGINTGTVIFLLVAALAAGGAGYYIKIYKPRQQAPDAEEDYGEYGDDDEELEYDDPEDAGDGYEGYADVPYDEYPDADADFDPGDEGDSRPGEEE